MTPCLVISKAQIAERGLETAGHDRWKRLASGILSHVNKPIRLPGFLELLDRLLTDEVSAPQR